MSKFLRRFVFFLGGVTFIILLSLAMLNTALAGDPHHTHDGGGTSETTVVNNYSITDVSSISTGVSQSDLDEAASKAMACAPSYYMGTKRYQASVQGAVFRGKTSLCLGLGKVVGEDKDVMINFNIVPDEDDNIEDWGYQGGVLFLF